MKYAERHCGKAVIKDQNLLPEALEKLEKQEEGCKGCEYEECTKQLYPCRTCRRDKNDHFEQRRKE